MNSNNQHSTRILMCSPEFFSVSYEINPWMHKQSEPLQELANKQWANLRNTILKLGAQIDYIDPVSNLPDMVYTANGGLHWKNKVVVSHFRHPERQGEEPHFHSWFKFQGFECSHSTNHIFEGAGDALFLGETLFCGYGIRSEKAAYPEILKFLGVEKTVDCELINPSFYHLDICFCPLSNSKALVYPEAFTSDSWEKIKSACEPLIIPKEEAHRFAGNSVVIGNSVIIPAGCPSTEVMLKQHGFEVYSVELSELLKGGGAAKCMTLQIGLSK